MWSGRGDSNARPPALEASGRRFAVSRHNRSNPVHVNDLQRSPGSRLEHDRSPAAFCAAFSDAGSQKPGARPCSALNQGGGYRNAECSSCGERGRSGQGSTGCILFTRFVIGRHGCVSENSRPVLGSAIRPSCQPVDDDDLHPPE